MEEYKTYRAEILANQEIYIKTITVAATAVGVLMAVYFGKDTTYLSRASILIAVMIIISSTIFSVYRKFMHSESIARYVGFSERRINSISGTEMDWEIDKKQKIRIEMRDELDAALKSTRSSFMQRMGVKREKV